jgi:hypothetical protein
VAAGVVALAIPAPASAQAVLDATCAGPREGTSQSSTNSRRGQTFTALNSGSLTSAQIDVSAIAAGDTFVVDILAVGGDGRPTDTVLASTTATAPTSGAQILTAIFPAPATVTAGQQYVLSTRNSTNNSAVGLRLGGDDCPGAAYISYEPTTGPWGGPYDEDIVFTVFVVPAPEPEPGPQPKADRTLTLDADKSKVNKGKKVTLSGVLDAPGNEAACESGQTVELERKKPSQAVFATVKQLQTSPAGNFLTAEKVKKTFEYRGEVVESAQCQPGVSNTENVKVKKPR